MNLHWFSTGNVWANISASSKGSITKYYGLWFEILISLWQFFPIWSDKFKLRLNTFKLLSVSFEHNKGLEFEIWGSEILKNGKFFIKFRFNCTSQMHTLSSMEQLIVIFPLEFEVFNV